MILTDRLPREPGVWDRAVSGCQRGRALLSAWTLTSRFAGRLGLASLALLLLVGCGGGARLDARVLQLSITYSPAGPTEARVSGERGAATAGMAVECRLTSGSKPVVGQATSNQFGAFEMTLDHSAFPERVPTADEFRTFNETIECRPEGGSWVSPLRQPVIRVG